MNGQPACGRNDGERRLRVLVADDNASILAKASTRLARDFEVVAAVSDGRQAVYAARRLDPDVAVLDVTMPELDGFQTARVLKQSGSRAKIVMMTMHDSDEFVAAAIESGAHGYVLKTRMQSDLKAPSITRSPDGSSCLRSPRFLPSPRLQALADTRCCWASSLACSWMT